MVVKSLWFWSLLHGPPFTPLHPPICSLQYKQIGQVYNRSHYRISPGKNPQARVQVERGRQAEPARPNNSLLSFIFPFLSMYLCLCIFIYVSLSMYLCLSVFIICDSKNQFLPDPARHNMQNKPEKYNYFNNLQAKQTRTHCH